MKEHKNTLRYMDNNDIINLQQKYLDTKDVSVLEELYTNLLRLSFHLLKYKNYYYMSYEQSGIVVKDIASNIISRLIEKETPIIISNPISYLSRAILYASNPTRKNKIQFVSLEEFGDTLYDGSKDPVGEMVISNEFENEVHKFLDERLEYVSDDIDKETLRKAFFDCLSLGKHYSKYIYKLHGKVMKAKFVEIMEDFRDFLNDC